MQIHQLVELAEKKAGSLNKAEAALDISKGTLSRYRSGSTSKPEPEIVALLAEYVGADPTAALLEATRARSRSTVAQALFDRLLRKHAATAGTTLGALLVAYLVGGSDLTANEFAAFFALMAYPQYTLSLFVVLVMALGLAKTAADRATVARTCPGS